ncbi:hypothetical protein DFH07DRAFT_930958 [Mycena maculata]|uniref:GATA-type domain-containing protein n=1 Tax=Mycena maculata TaxID=230809 RepID=A0AAD7HTJ0_9AGAR|nr:hypothetical protein DFH07DRAFT_930958 [Mycena maculata]
MPSILNLKFKGNKSFVAFNNLNDTESLAKTWKVCTRVASHLEQGQRLENLSWRHLFLTMRSLCRRLWHLQNLIVDTDNAKSKREFKKLSKCMGYKLDKEKGRSLEELAAPDFKPNPSTDLISQRAVEKQHTREASMHTPEHTIQRMQFSFSVDPPVPSSTTTTTTSRTTSNANTTSIFTSSTSSTSPSTSPSATANNANANADSPMLPAGETAVRLPTLFSTSFGLVALLFPAPTLTPRMNYGEAATQRGRGGVHNGMDSDMRVVRPTIELPLDELLNVDADADDMLGALAEEDENEEFGDGVGEAPPLVPAPASPSVSTSASTNNSTNNANNNVDGASAYLTYAAELERKMEPESSDDGGDDSADSDFFEQRGRRPVLSVRVPGAGGESGGWRVKGVCPPSAVSAPQARKAQQPEGGGQQGGEGQVGTVQGSGRGAGDGTNVTSAPGGVKAQCSNCGATHTPLWRRGLNDELNCNACGLYCKLHNRPRPKTMRNTGGGGEGRGQSVRVETVDVMAQCYNCHTTATTLWRKDDEGKTVCNACGLYSQLHGASRPISMKSDVIRKRSRHGASASVSETPTASPAVSRRASPVPDRAGFSASAFAGRASPTLAPDGNTTPHNYDAWSELSALGLNDELNSNRPFPHSQIAQQTQLWNHNDSPTLQSSIATIAPGPSHIPQRYPMNFSFQTLPLPSTSFTTNISSTSNAKSKERAKKKCAACRDHQCLRALDCKGSGGRDKCMCVTTGAHAGPKQSRR